MRIPRLIALDLDGTMLDDDRRVTPRTKAAIRAAQECGIRVAVASGRMYSSAMVSIREAGIESVCAFFNGALICDPLTGKTVFEKPVEPELTAEILKFFRKNNWYVQIYKGDELIVEKRDDERCRYYEKYFSGKSASEMGENFWDSEIASSKLLAIEFDETEFLRMRSETERAFGDKVYITTSCSSFLEMVDCDVNKAKALEFLCKYYGIAREDAMAFGDGGNDMKMLQWAGTGVAMGNARDSIKAAADITALPNTEDGAARIIEEVVAAAHGDWDSAAWSPHSAR